MKKIMNENKIIETLKYISQFIENRHDEGLRDYLHIVIGRTDINVIDETIYLLERKQKEIEELKQYKESVEGLKSKNKTIIDNNELQIFLKRDYVEKDKIREKIKELENFKNKNLIMYSHDFFGIERIIKVLEELLEE
jgi:ATP:corrinoid adenosyltransferase